MSNDYLLKAFVDSIGANGFNWLRPQNSHPCNANEGDAYYNAAFECGYVMTVEGWIPLGRGRSTRSQRNVRNVGGLNRDPAERNRFVYRNETW